VAIRRCPYCKAIIDESQKYCNNCGTQLLFPEDDLNDEPIKGEKILAEDYKEDSGVKGLDDPVDDVGLDQEEIDLEAVLKGSGHFPDEPASAPGRGGLEPKREPPGPAEALSPEAIPPPTPPRRPSRPRKKSESAPPKNDTREEIAKLIAALEEKEKKGGETPAEETPTPGDIPVLKPEGDLRKESFDIPADESAAAPSSWEALLKKPVTVDLDNGPLPGAFEPSDGAGARGRAGLEEPAANETTGDTLDFEDEVFRSAPRSVASPTRMGIPEGVTGESLGPSRLDAANESPAEEEHHFGRGVAEPAAAVPASSMLGEESSAPRRLGFFRKIAALLFDVLFIGAICLASLWLAARLMDVALFDLITAARISIGLYFLVLLFGYFFLFLFFLGETLGDRMASPRP
jgi:hypothetical protein